MSDNLANYPITMALGKAALVAGTTTTITTTGTLPYAIRSKAYSRAALTNSATPTTDINTGLAFLPLAFPASALVGGQGSVFVIGFNAAGSTVVAQGSVVQLDVTGAFVVAPQFPVLPDNFCPASYLVVKLGPTAVANWVFGVNNLSAVTGVTYTFVDVVMLPDRPQIS